MITRNPLFVEVKLSDKFLNDLYNETVNRFGSEGAEAFEAMLTHLYSPEQAHYIRRSIQLDRIHG